MFPAGLVPVGGGSHIQAVGSLLWDLQPFREQEARAVAKIARARPADPASGGGRLMWSGKEVEVAVLKIKRFGGDNRAKLEKDIDVWLAKQGDNKVVQRTEVVPTSQTAPIEPPIVVVTVWSEQQ